MRLVQRVEVSFYRTFTPFDVQKLLCFDHFNPSHRHSLIAFLFKERMNSKGIRFKSNGVSLKAVKAQQTHIQENLVSIQEGMWKGLILISNTVGLNESVASGTKRLESGIPSMHVFHPVKDTTKSQRLSPPQSLIPTKILHTIPSVERWHGDDEPAFSVKQGLRWGFPGVLEREMEVDFGWDTQFHQPK